MSPDRAVWQALAHEALLDHVNRGDARHALKLLVDALARHCAQVCTLSAHADDGSMRWVMQGRPGATAAADDLAARRRRNG